MYDLTEPTGMLFCLDNHDVTDAVQLVTDWYLLVTAGNGLVPLAALFGGGTAGQRDLELIILEQLSF